MGRIVVGTFVSVDGVMQAPGGPEEDGDGGFAHGGWTVPHWDEAMMEKIAELTARADAILLGRKTYDIFAAHWPRIDDPTDLVAVKLNHGKKYVASRTLQHPEWENTEVLQGAVPAAVAKLKDIVDGEIQVTGSWELLQTLNAHALADEYRLWVFPVILGQGKRLFGDGALPTGLSLASTGHFSTGVILNIYLRTGTVGTGSFALEGEG